MSYRHEHDCVIGATGRERLLDVNRLADLGLLTHARSTASITETDVWLVQRSLGCAVSAPGLPVAAAPPRFTGTGTFTPPPSSSP